MNGPALRVDSATGVEVQLPVAGAGGRAFAFIIDWHIRLILALAWYLVAALLYNRRWSLAAPVDPHGAWFTGVLAPAFALYFLYHPLLELALRGRTPGKRIAGVRIVSTTGATPGAAAILMRNVFRLIDSFPGLYCVGLIATLVTPNQVRIGDLAAGTLLVYEHDELFAHRPDSLGAAAPAANDPRVAELAAELLGRWPQLADDARLGLARELLARAAGALPVGAVLTDARMLRTQLARLAGIRP